MRHPLSLFNFCPKCGSSAFIENDFKSKRCEDCGFIYYFNPLAATAAIITNDKGEILVATRSKEPAKGTLDLPGGFCDSYETAEEGVAREVLEETGLKVTSTEYLFTIPNIYNYSGMGFIIKFPTKDPAAPTAAVIIPVFFFLAAASFCSCHFFASSPFGSDNARANDVYIPVVFPA